MVHGINRGDESVTPRHRVLEMDDLSAMEAFGRDLGRCLFPGAVIALIGPLGAGKTHLARFIAQGLAIVDASTVTSPTFVLIQEYSARIPIYHFDAYRLTSVAAFADLGVEEYFHGAGVCLVEWADRVSDTLPLDHLRVVIEVIDDNRRRVTIESKGPRHDQVLTAMTLTPPVR